MRSCPCRPRNCRSDRSIRRTLPSSPTRRAVLRLRRAIVAADNGTAAGATRLEPLEDDDDPPDEDDPSPLGPAALVDPPLSPTDQKPVPPLPVPQAQRTADAVNQSMPVDGESFWMRIPYLRRR
jgi:hypothetical protein